MGHRVMVVVEFVIVKEVEFLFNMTQGVIPIPPTDKNRPATISPLLLPISCKEYIRPRGHNESPSQKARLQQAADSPASSLTSRNLAITGHQSLSISSSTCRSCWLRRRQQ